MEVLKNIEQPQMKTGIPSFGPGDTLRIKVKVKEGDKTRLQVFQGVVLGRRGSGLRESFTLRKVSDGVGVERIFPLHSPSLAEIEVVRKGAVRRSKINYLKELKGKQARIKEKRPVGREKPARGARSHRARTARKAAKASQVAHAAPPQPADPKPEG